MTTRKKNTAAAAPAEAAHAAVAAPASAPAGKPAAPPAAASKKAPSKSAKAPDPAVQSSREALAKALAAAQAVKIEQPLGKPAKAEREAKAGGKAEKAPKARKAKLVRDSFTMPENEYARIAELKKRLLARGRVSKKSELLRAGVALLAALEDADLVAAMEKVEVIKTGRPAKSAR